MIIYICLHAIHFCKLSEDHNGDIKIGELFLSFFTIISSVLTVKRALKELIVEPLKRLDKYSNEQEFEDVKELMHFFHDGRVPYGTLVNLEGTFSEYSHTYHPITYMPTIQVSTDSEHVKMFTYKASSKFGLFQPPVETMPEIQFDGRNYRLGFIYPNDFEGFRYNSLFKSYEEAVKENLPYINIPDSAKPVPIIYRGDKTYSSGDKFIIKAKVIELPYEQINILAKHLDGFPGIAFSKVFDFLSTNKKSLCLLVDNETTTLKKKDIYSVESFPATFFIEGHLEQKNGDLDLTDVLYNAIPNYIEPPIVNNGKKIYGINYKGFIDHSSLFTTGDVRIIFRKPFFIGFYIEIDLANSNNYKSCLEELKKTVRKFDQNVQYNTNRKAFFHVDFISDKKLINYLGLPRVLTGTQTLNLINQQPELAETREWLIK